MGMARKQHALLFVLKINSEGIARKYFYKKMADAGIETHCFDRRGFGLSGGKKGERKLEHTV